MLHACTHCDQTFATHLQKANHIRWKHVQPGYTPKGRIAIQESVRALNKKRSDEAGEWIVETRSCRCGNTFEASYKENYKRRGRKTCSKKCGATRDFSHATLQKMSEGSKRWIKENPEKFAKDQASRNLNPRRSSKAERALAELLKSEGFLRARVIRTPDLNFAVDITSPCRKIWIESDGPYHFKKVHKNHDFDKSKRRDELQEKEALKRNILLIRVNNQKFSLEEQLQFVRDSISAWDETGAVKKLY